MSAETPEQKKLREHYEKKYKEALAKGPIRFELLDEDMKDYYAWQWCQIDHVCMAVGGFANFRYWIVLQAETNFKLQEEMCKLIKQAKRCGIPEAYSFINKNPELFKDKQ